MSTPTRTERNSAVTTATAPATAEPARTVTAEEATRAQKKIADLDRTDQTSLAVLLVLGIGGLIFTAVNVTIFAMDHHVHGAIAWMLDPLVSVSMLGAMFIDGRLASHGYKSSSWPFVLRWFAGLTTWLMNCWGSLYPDAEFTGLPRDLDPAGLLLHSAIPAIVICLAEAGAGWRKFSTKKRVEYQAVIEARKDQESARLRAAAEKREREAEAERAAEAAERNRAAELAAEEKRAALEVRKARELSDAKAREIREADEAEARRAERARQEEERRESAAEVRSRREAEARDQQARIDRDNTAHKAALERQRIEAEALAEAVRIKAEAEVDEKRRTAEARRTRAALPARPTAEPAPDPTALPVKAATAQPQKRAALPADAPPAEPQNRTALPAGRTAETDDVRGAEAKRKQIEEATFEAAVLLFMSTAPTRREFADRYGRSETWGRERYAEAERLMAEDADYAVRVLAEADQRTTVQTP